MAMKTVTVEPVKVTDSVTRDKVEDMYQVVLWNDDYNEAGFVVRCLMGIFGHPRPLARKIMLEAHNNGKSIAEVEGAESAKKHSKALQTAGLQSTVEKI